VTTSSASGDDGRTQWVVSCDSPWPNLTVELLVEPEAPPISSTGASVFVFLSPSEYDGRSGGSAGEPGPNLPRPVLPLRTML